MSENPSPTVLPRHSAEGSALILHGLARGIGDVAWPQPSSPFSADRATLLAATLPRWAVAAGNTAGWVWTGMGLPQPWSLLCRKGPAPSPMARAQWKPRQRIVPDTSLRTLRGLVLLSPSETARDLLTTPGSDEAAVAPLFVLLEVAGDEEVALLWQKAPRQSGEISERARRRLTLLEQWRKTYA